MSWQHSTKMEGAPIDEAPASGQEPVGAPHEENPPHNDDNPVTKLFKDMGTKVKNVVGAVERMEEEVMDDKTVNDKVKAIQHTRNVKTLRQMWIDLILSKEFTTIIDQVFDKCCKLNDDDEDGHEGDGKLDRTELGAAMTMLWERLDQKTGGGKKLPRIKESEETVLRRYDADSDGHLDRDEFHGFARTYFRWVGAHPLPAILKHNRGSPLRREAAWPGAVRVHARLVAVDDRDGDPPLLSVHALVSRS